ncbi:sigma-54-dependent transcriptional regulator [Sphingomonas endolithica]|uniref:sigma-54-dependent transcriptional regulator n=1 Tax=Sphingomonas endolithica TaxID=2972485 RepID=UPI0021B00705|nr:sigma-54 dependent transcriptional regulator [Sphingomonas sp. ZFBP2030]
MTGQTVLFVEDDDTLRQATVQALELAGFAVRAFSGAEAALTAIPPNFDGVIVSDIRMPRMDGLQLLAQVRARDPDLPVILVTGHGDVPMAVAALKDGAFDFLTKPFAADHLALTVTRALERRGLLIENRRLRAAAAISEAAGPLLDESGAMARLREQVRQFADTDMDVLIEGEPGTGKDLIATMLHRGSSRCARSLIVVPCEALSDEQAAIELFGHAADSVPHTRLARVGQIVASSGGTLLLDAIDALPLPLQARLLRVIEDREVQPVGAVRAEAVNLRLVATASDLSSAVRDGRFRADLYHRLAATCLRPPPLREREQDQLMLFAVFVDQAREQLGLPPYAMTDQDRRHLLAHDWPGNVRELRNFAFAVCNSAQSGVSSEPIDLRARVATFEASIIIDALTATGGNVVKALGLLKTSRRTLYDKLERHGIDPEAFRKD